MAQMNSQQMHIMQMQQQQQQQQQMMAQMNPQQQMHMMQMQQQQQQAQQQNVSRLFLSLFVPSAFYLWASFDFSNNSNLVRAKKISL